MIPVQDPVAAAALDQELDKAGALLIAPYVPALKVRIEIDEPYGVDEFMYFLEGSVTLTSSDGSEQVINAGEAVTIPKEWTGVWETDGYTKIWVIYSADGSGL